MMQWMREPRLHARDFGFESIVWLDDVRMPLLDGVVWVKSYEAFVRHLERRGVPELICFDHDLSQEHYPRGEQDTREEIPYDRYTEKTGMAAALYVAEHQIPLQFWFVQSLNPRGRANIRRVLRAYRPEGECTTLEIPFRLVPERSSTQPTGNR